MMERDSYDQIREAGLRSNLYWLVLVAHMGLVYVMARHGQFMGRQLPKENWEVAYYGGQVNMVTSSLLLIAYGDKGREMRQRAKKYVRWLERSEAVVPQQLYDREDQKRFVVEYLEERGDDEG